MNLAETSTVKSQPSVPGLIYVIMCLQIHKHIASCLSLFRFLCVCCSLRYGVQLKSEHLFLLLIIVHRIVHTGIRCTLDLESSVTVTMPS